MLRLSFIVPFYNVEPYIEECIRSLYNQDIPQEEYEVICVDDCSPDGSRAIVERLQKEYPTLKLLIHTENKRQGGARNTGLREAKGRYIWFVDSDDYIKPNCLKNLLSIAEKEKLDILKFYHQVEGNSKEPKMIDYGSCSGSELIFDAPMAEKIDQRCCCVTDGIVLREHILKHNISFAEKVQYEDDDYAYQLYAYAKRVHLVKQATYIVRETPNSAIRRKTDRRKIHDVYVQLLRIAGMDNTLSVIEERWHKFIVDIIAWTIDGYFMPMIKELSYKERLCVFIETYKFHRALRPYLTKRSYARLRNFICWCC